MYQNVGLYDRIIRVIAGLAIGAVGFVNPSVWWVSLIGLVPLLTAGIGICPLYLPFGISTVLKKK